MAVSAAFLDMLHEMLTPLGALSVRRMFGAAAVYCDGIVFALAIDDELYFKADAETKAVFEAEGSTRFTYQGARGPVSLPYWKAPERLFDDAEEMLVFARRALSAAARQEAARANPNQRASIRRR